MFDVIDGQMHLFQTMGASACLAAMDALGISGLLIDEAWTVDISVPPQPSVMLPSGVRRALALRGKVATMENPGRFRYLLRVDHRDPDLACLMRLEAQDPHLAAFRAICEPGQLPDLTAGDFAPVFQNAAILGRPVFVQTLGESQALEPYFSSVPECQFVIDHIGLIKSREAWEVLLRLARYANVSLKWSHANLAFPSPTYPFAPAQKALREAVDAFGSDRILWASDASMLRPQVSWAEALFCVRDNSLLTLDERAGVLGGSARRLLQWPR